MEVFETKRASETENLGNDLAGSVRSGSGAGKFVSMYRYIGTNNRSKNQAFVLTLNGELGSGKTTFIKGFARGLGIEETVTSPTYVFARSYSFEPIVRPGFHKDTLYHLDLYRLENGDTRTLESFGFKEIVSDSSGIVIIEWAEKIEGKLSRPPIKLYFEYSSLGRIIRML